MSVDNQTAQKASSRGQGNTAQRIFTGAHTFFYRLSGGKLGGRFRKSPVLLLITTGRKTGKQRTTPLLYLRDGNNIVLVASNGGAAKHPTWWLNLQTHPQTEVEVGSQKLHVTARQANAEERQHLWPLLVDMYSPYDDYQQKTSREIPVVILEPVEALR